MSSKVAEKEDKDKKEAVEEDTLSEEDQRIKEELELLVERAGDANEELALAAVNAMKKEIRTSTSSMTSVPKPLKFLRPHYDTLKATYAKLQTNKCKQTLADVLSWLGMTAGLETRDALRFRLLGSSEDVGLWGHEYVRHLCLEIGDEFQEKQDEEADVGYLLDLVDLIVPFLVNHHAEPDACDLLIEVEQIDKMVDFVSEHNYKRTCLYLESCANYLPCPDDLVVLKVTMKIYQKMGLTPETMKLALAMNDHETIKELMRTQDRVMRRQLALILGEHGYFNLINFNDDEMGVEEVEEDDEVPLADLMGNIKRPEHFNTILAVDLEITEPKLPEDIYKSHLDAKQASVKADSARQNLAKTFVNAFVNAGFGSDKLLTAEGTDGGWIFKNREHGRISAAASVGLIHLWDNASGVNELEKYSALKGDVIEAGVMLGIGMTNINIRDTFNITLTYAEEHMKSESTLVKQCTALALGFAYAGTPTISSVRALLESAYEDAGNSAELQAHIALALVNVGTCDSDLIELFVNTLMESGSTDELPNTYSRYLCLALGLLFLGKQEEADVTLETLKIVPGIMGKYAALTVETCAYVNTGNVLKIQKLLATCGEHLDEKENAHQAVAVLGIALIALREEIGRQMVIRSFDHLLQYGEVNIRRAVPLALGILSISNPDLPIMDTLSKFSHDHDQETAMGAIFSLGLIGAGTNNSRIAQMLRGLASYYHKEANQLFVVRLAQGLLHMGKGTISLNPYHADRFLLRPAPMAGLLATIHTCFDFKNLILGQAHYMLYNLVLAMHPRMLMTFDENLNPLPVLVRVGQAIDVVGKAGNPKNITGFQTHTTPVLLGVGDRAELATDEYTAVSPILEGCVILKQNPESKKLKKKQK